MLRGGHAHLSYHTLVHFSALSQILLPLQQHYWGINVRGLYFIVRIKTSFNFKCSCIWCILIPIVYMALPFILSWLKYHNLLEGLAFSLNIWLHWRFNIRFFSFKIIQQNSEIIESWTSSTQKPHEMCGSELFWCMPDIKKKNKQHKKNFVMLTYKTQHLWKKTTEFSLRQTSKWIEK